MGFETLEQSNLIPSHAPYFCKNKPYIYIYILTNNKGKCFCHLSHSQSLPYMCQTNMSPLPLVKLLFSYTSFFWSTWSTSAYSIKGVTDLFRFLMKMIQNSKSQIPNSKSGFFLSLRLTHAYPFSLFEKYYAQFALEFCNSRFAIMEYSSQIYGNLLFKSIIEVCR